MKNKLFFLLFMLAKENMEPYHAKIGKYIDSRDNKFQKLKTRELFEKPI